jgi:TetR/AcrR family transcriptional repressor of nem operon
LFRERGLDSVSLPDVMAEVGLTRGGFYKHFESKEALVAAAVDRAFSEQRELLANTVEQYPDDPGAACEAFLDRYLSLAHRDDPAGGCPTALASAMCYRDASSAPRAAFIEGIHKLLAICRAGDVSADPDERQSQILGELATLVGALMLARATAGDDLSEAILIAARRRLAHAPSHH